MLTIFIMLMCHDISSLLIIKYLQIVYHIQTLCEKLLGMSKQQVLMQMFLFQNKNKCFPDLCFLIIQKKKVKINRLDLLLSKGNKTWIDDLKVIFQVYQILQLFHCPIPRFYETKKCYQDCFIYVLLFYLSESSTVLIR